MVDHEKGRKLSRSKKYLSPHLVGSEKAKKLTPLKNFLFWLQIGAIFLCRTARGSEMEPFFVYGIKSDAISIAEFIGVGSKIDAIKISACLFSEADARFSYSFFTVAAGSAAH